MKRTALCVAALFVTASALMYLVGLKAIFILGTVLCIASAALVVFGRYKALGLKPAAVLLVGAAFCLFLRIYDEVKVSRVEALEGDTRTVTCRVTEEPRVYEYSTYFRVKTDGTNGFDEGPTGSVDLIIYIKNDSPAASASVGDILSAELTFNATDSAVKKHRMSDQIFISTYCESAEIIGHKDSVYTFFADVRRAVKGCIRNYMSGDTAAIAEGIMLGGTEEMSDELYSQFKACGVSHITAVSGMHISAFCMMLMTLFNTFMKRRKAAALTIVPLISAVMLAGLTPSAVRAGIMCGLSLLSDCLLKKTDSLNSLGVAIAVMLTVNPYYVCSLGFQLSCSAAAGIIIVSPYAETIANRLPDIRPLLLRRILHTAVTTFIQSVGAIICTLPFQVIEFGFISLTAPLAGVLICSAAIYTMVLSILGTVLHFIPYIHYLAAVPFAAAELLAEYIRICVRTLSGIPFSCIPFGNNSVILWLGLSMMTILIWILFGRTGGKRAVSLVISAILLVSLWSDHILTRKTAVVSVQDAGNGLCVAVTYGTSCVIIGCGDDSGDRYALQNFIKHNGITKVEMLLIPSDSDTCFKGYNGLMKEIKPEATVVPTCFDSTSVLTGEVIRLADRTAITAADGNIQIKPILYGDGCIYSIDCCGKMILVGCGRYDAENLGISGADLVISGRAVPFNTDADITVISADSEDYGNICNDGRVITTSGRTVSVKLKHERGLAVYVE